MKQIMMPVKPKWVAKILNGEKTLEIRKTAPKEWVDYINGKTKKKPEPMIVNIYCSKDEKRPIYLPWSFSVHKENGEYVADCDFHKANGKVAAKFVLEKVEKVKFSKWFGEYRTDKYEHITFCEKTCVSGGFIHKYLKGKVGYAWHISDLKIFDEPKELRKFSVTKKYKSCDKCPHHEYDESFEHCVTCEEQVPLKRAPESWCYVEERQ